MRHHVTSKKALVITNDKVGPFYLDKTVKVGGCDEAQDVTIITVHGKYDY